MTDTEFRLQRPTYDELILPGDTDRFDMPGTASEFLDVTYRAMGRVMQKASMDTGYQVIGSGEIFNNEHTVVALNHVSNMDTPLAALLTRGLQTGLLSHERVIPGTLTSFEQVEDLSRPAQKDAVAIGKVAIFKSPLLAEFFATGAVPAQRGEKPDPDYEQSKLLDSLYKLDSFAAAMLYSYVRRNPGEGQHRLRKLHGIIQDARKTERKPILDPAKNSADYNLPMIDTRTTLELGRAARDSGRPLVIFPQGKRKAPGAVDDIESGVALFSEGAKVIPIGHDGTQFMGVRHKVFNSEGEQLAKRRTRRNQRGPVVVAIGEAIEGPTNRQERKDFLAELRSRLDSLTKTATETRSDLMSTL